MRIGPVLAARFTLSGAVVDAIRFTGSDGRGEYFDADRQVDARVVPARAARVPPRLEHVRHALPSDPRDLAQAPGHRLRGGAGHAGARDRRRHGDVAGRRSGYGNLLEIRHHNGFVTRYGHLSGFAAGIRAGRRHHRADGRATSGRRDSRPGRTSTSRCWSTASSAIRGAPSRTARARRSPARDTRRASRRERARGRSRSLDGPARAPRSRRRRLSFRACRPGSSPLSAGLALAWLLVPWRARALRAPRSSRCARSRRRSSLALLLDAPAARARAGPPLVGARRLGELAARRRHRAVARGAARGARRGRRHALARRRFAARGAGARRPRATSRRALAPAAARALGAGRPLPLVTDGELDDPAALGALPPGSRIEVLPRAPRADAAVARLDALAHRRRRRHGRRARRPSAPATRRCPPATLTLASTGGRLATRAASSRCRARRGRVVPLRARGAAAPGARSCCGGRRAPGDAEPRNDTLTVRARPVARAPARSSSRRRPTRTRAARAVLRGALALPTRGFFRVAPGEWRREGTLDARPRGRGARRAARRAGRDHARRHRALRRAARGDAAARSCSGRRPSATRASGSRRPRPPSPRRRRAGRHAVGQPAAGRASPTRPPGGDVERARGARGAPRRRARRDRRRGRAAGAQVVAGASGFWRWRFRGGASAAAFTALWGSIFDWLAAERRDPRAAVPDERRAPRRRPGALASRRRAVGLAPVTVALRRRGARARIR